MLGQDGWPTQSQAQKTNVSFDTISLCLGVAYPLPRQTTRLDVVIRQSVLTPQSISGAFCQSKKGCNVSSLDRMPGSSMSSLGGLLALFALVLLFPSCAWVKLEPKAEQVRVVNSAADAASCKKLSEIGASTTSRVAFIARSAQKVETELETLARNDAQKRGANVIAPLGPVTADGTRRYAAFRCGP